MSVYVAYYRVSTSKQERSGLGLEAQRAAIAAFLKGNGGQLLHELVETGSGAENERPLLNEALRLCVVTRAILLVAKQDRLSRDVEQVARLQKSGVSFVSVDMPEADALMIGVNAVFGQRERELIGKRTREALQAKKAQGVKLGNPHGSLYFQLAGKGNKAANKARKRKADAYAEAMRPDIEALLGKGIKDREFVADALNKAGRLTPRGKKWWASSVYVLLKRLGLPLLDGKERSLCNSLSESS